MRCFFFLIYAFISINYYFFDFINIFHMEISDKWTTIHQSISELLIVGLPLFNDILNIFTEMSHTRVNASVWICRIFHILNFPFFQNNIRLNINSSWSSVSLNDFSEFQELFIYLNLNENITYKYLLK